MTIGQVYDSYVSSDISTAYSTWDSNHTAMCICDIGYSGPSCSTRKSS